MIDIVKVLREQHIEPLFYENEKTGYQYWFRATDVCGFLGFSDPFRAVHVHCDSDHRRYLRAGKGRPAIHVCEVGVYYLLEKSKSPIAEEFMKNLCEDVLTSIDRDGCYINPSATPEQLKELSRQLDEIKTRNGYT